MTEVSKKQIQAACDAAELHHGLAIDPAIMMDALDAALSAQPQVEQFGAMGAEFIEAQPQGEAGELAEPLTWFRLSAISSRADAIGLRFYVYHNPAGHWSAYTEGFEQWRAEFHSEDEAKAGAEQEYRRRILSALRAQGAGEAEPDLVKRVGDLLGDDPVCSGRVCVGTIKAIANLLVPTSADEALERDKIIDECAQAVVAYCERQNNAGKTSSFPDAVRAIERLKGSAVDG